MVDPPNLSSLSRRSVLALTPACIFPPTMPPTTDDPAYVEQISDHDALVYRREESRTKIQPTYIFDRIRWAGEWSPGDLSGLSTYNPDGYLVTIAITPGMGDDHELTESDLAFDTTGPSTGDPALFRDRRPEAGMVVHPTEAIPLFEPSETFDYHIPSGIVVEVGPDDLSITYGVESGEGMVGREVWLPEMDRLAGDEEG